jgi:Cytochrome oxidase complex assembly protein 1
MEQPPISPASPPLRKSWWGRNWKWLVPTGCLGLAFLVAGFVALLVVVIFGAMKSSDIYKDALAKARANPAVIGALGSPIKEGMFLSGNTNVNGASGEANLAIPISGPNGKGTIYVAASKSAGEWAYATLAVEIEKTHERIDLIRTRNPQKMSPPSP